MILQSLFKTKAVYLFSVAEFMAGCDRAETLGISFSKDWLIYMNNYYIFVLIYQLDEE